MDFDKMLRSSTKEMTLFVKRNTAKFAVIGDLTKARDGCTTKEGRALIQDIILPLQKELRKECDAFDARMSSIWKPAKGEDVPKNTQKKLDSALKKETSTLRSKSGTNVAPNGNTSHSKWIEVEAFSI